MAHAVAADTDPTRDRQKQNTFDLFRWIKQNHVGSYVGNGKKTVPRNHGRIHLGRFAAGGVSANVRVTPVHQDRCLHAVSGPRDRQRHSGIKPTHAAVDRFDRWCFRNLDRAHHANLDERDRLQVHHLGQALHLALPAFMPVAFELTILLASFGAFFGMWALNGLPRFSNPMFTDPRFDRATDDRFFLYIDAKDDDTTPREYESSLPTPAVNTSTSCRGRLAQEGSQAGLYGLGH